MKWNKLMVLLGIMMLVCIISILTTWQYMSTEERQNLLILFKPLMNWPTVLMILGFSALMTALTIGIDWWQKKKSNLPVK